MPGFKAALAPPPRSMLPGVSLLELLQERREGPTFQLGVPAAAPKLAFTALHQAVLSGRANQVRLLAAKTPDASDSRDLHGRTPLMLCALVDNERTGLRIARILFDFDPFLGWKDKEGRTALAYACICGRERLAQLLLRREPRRLLDPDAQGDLPLHHAARGGSVAILGLLLDEYAAMQEPPTARSGAGLPPLGLACMNGRSHAALLLLDKARAAPSERDTRFHRTPLQWLEQPLVPTWADPSSPQPKAAKLGWSQMTLTYDKKASALPTPRDGPSTAPSNCAALLNPEDLVFDSVAKLEALSDKEALAQLLVRLRKAETPPETKRGLRLATPAIDSVRDKGRDSRVAHMFSMVSESLNSPCPARPLLPAVTIEEAASGRAASRGLAKMSTVLGAAEKFKKMKNARPK